MSAIDLSYARAAKLLLPAAEGFDLVLVGCGGTGSWLAPSVVRVARLLVEKFARRVAVYFVDPDQVEEKNVYRQNFCRAEVGRNKAETLAWRYGLAWGVDVAAIPEAYTDPVHGGLVGEVRRLPILIGCVDRASARREMAESLKGARAWWLDCGNAKSSGQVLLGGGSKGKDPFQLPGFCSWLPLPSAQHPELLQDEPEASMKAGGAAAAAAGEAGMSCADLALADSQGLAINQRIAAEATDYLVRMLLTKDLQKMATYIDLASGSSRSVYITPESVNGRGG